MGFTLLFRKWRCVYTNFEIASKYADENGDMKEGAVTDLTPEE
jgi:hypothetical protein